MTIALDFAGWYQCRLATDPDNFDEPRGSSGWIFAFGDEPFWMGGWDADALSGYTKGQLTVADV